MMYPWRNDALDVVAVGWKEIVVVHCAVLVGLKVFVTGANWKQCRGRKEQLHCSNH